MTDLQRKQLPIRSSDWIWPFGLSDLTFGLRRHLGDTDVQIVQVADISIPDRRPSIGRVRGIDVEYQCRDETHTCTLVVKEPQGTTRIGLAGAGKREIGLYDSLSEHLPLNTPQMLVGSPFGDWLILELIESSKDPSAWEAADYEKAVDQLSRLHDRFWALDVDLSTFPWLGRPLDADFEVYVTAAQQGLNRILESGKPSALAERPERMQLLERLISSAERIVAPLSGEMHTLLHGDYWPGNIAVLENGDQVVYDWQLAGVGPGVLDLLAFVYRSIWWFDGLPLQPEMLIQRYQHNIAELTGKAWSQVEWSLLWDHALMWRFVQEWIDLLALTPEPLLETWAERLEHVWIGPVRAAVNRRL